MLAHGIIPRVGTSSQILQCSTLHHVTPKSIPSPQRKLSSVPYRDRVVSVKRVGVSPPSSPIQQHPAEKGGKRDTLWQSWLNLTPSTRMLLGCALAVFAVGGIKVSDMLRAKMPVSDQGVEEEAAGQPGKEVKAPPLFRIKIVDRKE